STVVWFVFVLKSHFKDVQPGLFFIRIFRVLNTVQSFIFKVHVVVRSSDNVQYFITTFLLCQQLFSSFLFFFQMSAPFSRGEEYLIKHSRKCQPLFYHFPIYNRFEEDLIISCSML
ncbi:hypothetical protein DWZ40_11800, partial [Clostridium sp. AF32-12BH]